MRGAVIGIELERLLENDLGAGERFALGAVLKIAQTLHVVLIGFRHGGGVCAESLTLVSAKVDVQRIGDATGEFVFDGEQVGDGRGN